MIPLKKPKNDQYQEQKPDDIKKSKNAPSVKFHKEQVPILVPNYNTLYDTFRSTQAWNFISDNIIEGSVTTVAGTSAFTTLSFASDPQWRLKQWPEGIQIFLCVRWFACTFEGTSITTQGGIRATLVHKEGISVPLGCFKNSDSINVVHSAIIPSPVTDTGQREVGKIGLFLTSGASTGSYLFQLGFSAAYLLPSIKGYEIKHVDREEAEY